MIVDLQCDRFMQYAVDKFADVSKTKESKYGKLLSTFQLLSYRQATMNGRVNGGMTLFFSLSPVLPEFLQIR